MLDKRFGAAPVGRQGTAPEGVRKKLEQASSNPSKSQRQERSLAPSSTLSPEWQPMGAVAQVLLDKLDAQRERIRLIEQLIAWYYDLRQRVADADHRFMTRDCSQDPRDLELEWARFKLAAELAKKGRRQ